MKDKNCIIENRLEFLDVAKGLGILLVVLGHVSNNNKINNWIYSFHMPLFFFISGYLNSTIKKYDSNNQYIKKKFKTLLTPYFIFCILSYIYWITIEKNLRGDNIPIIRPLINVFIAQGGGNNYIFNAVMWFLPCLFVTEVIYYNINKNNNRREIIVILLLSSIVGYLISNYIEFRLPWCLDIMFTSLIFYGVGNLTSYKNVKYFNSIKGRKYLILTISSLLILSITSHYNGRVDMNNNILQNYFMFYISSFGGVIFILLISVKIKSKFIKYLGRNSLVIMLVHEPIKRVVLKLIEIVTQIKVDNLRNSLFLIIICSWIIIIIIIPLIFIINKFIPFSIGKSMKKYKIN